MMERRKRHELVDVLYEEKRLAELMRCVKPKQKGSFHSPKKQAELGVTNRRKAKTELKGEVRKHNSPRGNKESEKKE